MGQYKYPICLVKIEKEGNVSYEASLPDFSYMELCGRGKTAVAALKDVRQKKNLLFQDYKEKGIKLPEPNPDLINTDSIHHQLSYLYVGKKYTAFMIH